MKTGIMGGTFDPIHNGHILIARSAYEKVGLDKVLFMPSGNSYMKKNVLDVSKRVEMVRLAIADFPYFELSSIEAQRQGNTYTYDTLEQLTKQNPKDEYYFIMGADSLFSIELWRKFERIFELSTIICAVRDNYDMDMLKKKGNSLSAAYGADIIYLDMPKTDISSTDIRNNVKNNLPIEHLVPSKVADYIIQECLYNEKN